MQKQLFHHHTHKKKIGLPLYSFPWQCFLLLGQLSILHQHPLFWKCWMFPFGYHWAVGPVGHTPRVSGCSCYLQMWKLASHITAGKVSMPLADMGDLTLMGGRWVDNDPRFSPMHCSEACPGRFHVPSGCSCQVCLCLLVALLSGNQHWNSLFCIALPLPLPLSLSHILKLW